MAEAKQGPGYSKVPDRDDTAVVGRRIGAQLVDDIISLIILFVPILLFSGLGGSSGDSGSIGATIGVVIGGLGFLFYYLFLEGYWDGRTVGKHLLGIKVVKENGDQCSYGASVVRNLLVGIDGLLYFVVGFISMAMSDTRQRIGDRIAGTVVVREY